MKRFLLFSALICIAVFAVAQSRPFAAHRLHVQDVGMMCQDCHLQVVESTSAADVLRPDIETCTVCHEDESWPRQSLSKEMPREYIAHFSHVLHSGAMACNDCHAEQVNTGEPAMPSMASCQTCHDDLQEPEYCLVCHAGGETLTPKTHNINWTQAHATAASMNAQQCEQCHTQSECRSCHDSDNLDREVHPLNYINSHAALARHKKQDCSTCHQNYTSCNDCHRQELVLPKNHSTAGWLLPGSGGRHGRQAKWDLESCIACHAEGSGQEICARCHHAEN